MILPNFIGIGAPKSGTTWLAKCLGEHPDVFMAPVKETDKGVTFIVKLKAGRTKVQTWFLDRDGKELCGAFYTEVLRK